MPEEMTVETEWLKKWKEWYSQKAKCDKIMGELVEIKERSPVPLRRPPPAEE